MGELPSQLVQELVDYIIGFLHDSLADWLECALVSRSCVHTAQSHIFRRLSLRSPVRSKNERRWTHFLTTLDISPHLLRHVHQLHVHNFSGQFSTETFLRVCNFTFTDLDMASVAVHVNSTTAAALQQLLSTHPPPLRRLELVSRKNYSTVFFPATPVSMPIQLESLRIMVGSGIVDPLETELLGTEHAPALQTMETLELEVDVSIHQTTHYTLRVLHLTRLRISINLGESLLTSTPPRARLKEQVVGDKWTWLLASLSTISSSNRIAKIEIVSTFQRAMPSDFEQLDSLLATLPMPHAAIVELQMEPTRYDKVKPYLPQLSSKNTSLVDRRFNK
ncbi:hypothetical protein C8R44DRAFT_882619 [Mycena epipterygia]|nr:hypothetical protein C8R44DRAFT_882619 [Mycena epipterygia]